MNKNKQHALELRRLGLTLKEIGQELGVTRQRAGQVVGRTGKTAHVHERNERMLEPYLTVLGGERHHRMPKVRQEALVRAKSAARTYKRTGDRKYLNQACWLIRKWEFKVEEFR